MAREGYLNCVIEKALRKVTRGDTTPYQAYASLADYYHHIKFEFTGGSSLDDNILQQTVLTGITQ